MCADRVAGCELPRNNPLPGLAKVVDPQFNDIARLQVLWRPHAQADSSRCSSADDVTRQQCHELADVADESRYIENHFASGTTLPKFAVNLQPHSQMPRVRNLIICRQKRPQRRKRIRTLSL